MKKSITGIYSVLVILLSIYPAWALAYIKEAQQALDHNEYRTAVIHLKNALQKNPKDAEARLMLGEVYLKTFSPQAAEKELRAAIKYGAPRDKVLPLLARTYLLQRQAPRVIKEIQIEPDMTEHVKAQIATLQGDAYLELGETAKAKSAYQQALHFEQGFADAETGLAQVALSAKDYTGAQTHLDKVIASNPTHVLAWSTQGQLEYQQGKYPAALSSFNKALAGDADFFPALLGKAKTLIAQNHHEQAAAPVAKILQNFPENPQANYFNALIEFSRKNFDGTLAAIDNLEKYTLTHWPSQHLKAIVYYLTKQPQRAAEILVKVIKANPNHLGAAKLLANIYLELNEPQQAVSTLEPFLGKKPDPEVLSLVGSAYMKLNDHDKAAEYFDKAVALAPKDVNVRRLMAINVLNAGDSSEAINELNFAIQLDPNSIQQQYLLITALLRKEDFDTAVTTANKLIKQHPNDAVALNLMGNAYLGKGDNASAKQAFERAAKNDPQYITSRLNLGRIAELEGDMDSAKSHYQEALKINPNHLSALLSLGKIAVENRDLNQALTLFDKAAQANPNAIEPVLAKIDIYKRQQKYDLAINEARTKLSGNDESMELLEALGSTQLLAAQVSQAQATYEKITRLDPESAHAWTMLAIAELKQNQANNAKKHLAKALQLDNRNPTALANMAALQLQMDNPTDAMKNAKLLQRYYPEQGIGYELEGKTALKSKNYSQAEKAFTVGFNKQKSASLAVKLFQIRKFLNHEKTMYLPLRQWLEANPKDASIRLLLASELAKAGDADAAQTHLEYVLKDYPDNAPALNDLALLLYAKKDSRAVEYAQRAYKELPDNPNTADTLGWILVEKGETEAGLKLLSKASSLAPADGNINYHLAVAYNQAGSPAKAREILEKQLSADKSFSMAAAAQELLERIQK